MDVTEALDAWGAHGVKVSDRSPSEVHTDACPVGCLYVDGNIQSVESEDVTVVGACAITAHSVIVVLVGGVSVANLHQFSVEEGLEVVAVSTAGSESSDLVIASHEEAEVAMDYLVTQPFAVAKSDEVAMDD